MVKWSIGLIQGLIALLIFGAVLGVAGYVISVRNEATTIEVAFGASESNSKIVYDKMWKIVFEKAGVAKQYASDFKENFSAIMENRYGNPNNRANSMMLWIQEKNPEFDPSMYKDIMRSIESGREEFLLAQRKQIDLKRVHDEMRLKFPSSLCMFGKSEIRLKLVTSDRTEKAFETGKDSEINPFGR